MISLWIGIPNISIDGRRLETKSAARFVLAVRADQQTIGVLDQPLGPIRGRAAAYADGKRFRDVLRDRKQLWQWIEWVPPEILIEAGDDNPLTGIRELVADFDKVYIEELSLVDTDHLRSRVQEVEDFS